AVGAPLPKGLPDPVPGTPRNSGAELEKQRRRAQALDLQPKSPRRVRGSEQLASLAQIIPCAAALSRIADALPAAPHQALEPEAERTDQTGFFDCGAI